MLANVATNPSAAMPLPLQNLLGLIGNFVLFLAVLAVIWALFALFAWVERKFNVH